MREPSPVAAPYWGKLSNLSDPVKLQLMVLLGESMKIYTDNTDEEHRLTEIEKERQFRSLRGCWADDPEDAARMEKAILEAR